MVLSMCKGELPHQTKQMHEKYGPIVRCAPNELTFIDPAAWRDIYPPNFIRPYGFRDKPPGKDSENLISASEPDHTRFRKVLVPAFSEKSIQEQESTIKKHVNLLVRKLHQKIMEDVSVEAAVIDLLP